MGPGEDEAPGAALPAAPRGGVRAARCPPRPGGAPEPEAKRRAEPRRPRGADAGRARGGGDRAGPSPRCCPPRTVPKEGARGGKPWAQSSGPRPDIGRGGVWWPPGLGREGVHVRAERVPAAGASTPGTAGSGGGAGGRGRGGGDQICGAGTPLLLLLHSSLPPFLRAAWSPLLPRSLLTGFSKP